MYCHNCGNEIKDTLKFCTQCGVSVELKCPNCKNNYDDKDYFCGECGVNLVKLGIYQPELVRDRVSTNNLELEDNKDVGVNVEQVQLTPEEEILLKAKIEFGEKAKISRVYTITTKANPTGLKLGVVRVGTDIYESIPWSMFMKHVLVKFYEANSTKFKELATKKPFSLNIKQYPNLESALADNHNTALPISEDYYIAGPMASKRILDMLGTMSRYFKSASDVEFTMTSRRK